MMTINFKCLNSIGALLLFALSTTSAHAVLIYDWYINDANPVVGVNDVVSVDATIINDAASDQVFDLDAAITTAVASSFPWAAYTPVFGPGNINILGQFNGIVLNPGESFNFVFATLTPNPAPVAPGDYYLTGAGLVINGITDYWQVPNPLYDLYPCCANQYKPGVVKITVADNTPPPPQPVPAPPIIWLIASGLIGMVGFARVKARL